MGQVHTQEAGKGTGPILKASSYARVSPAPATHRGWVVNSQREEGGFYEVSRGSPL